MLMTETEFKDNAVVVKLIGRLDFEVTCKLRETLRDLLDQYTPKKLVIDLSELVRIDSNGLGLMIAMRNRAQKIYECEFVICGLCDAVSKIFHSTNLTAYFIIVDTF